MATLAARGSGTPVTSGTTWATLTNAVDGAAGSNPATYATYTNAVSAAVGTIEITGYGFSSTIGAADTLNSVTVNLRHFENNTARFASVRFQPYDGATAIGTAFTCTLATAARNDSTTFPVTLAQIRSSTFKIVVTITGAASTQSRIESIDYCDVTADYTPVPPAITQAAYRFYADGTETGSTALAALDTAPTIDTSAGDVNLQVRMRLQSTDAIPIAATDDWQLQWEHNTSGTWAPPVGPIAGNQLGPATNGWGATASGTRGWAQSFLGDGRSLDHVTFHLKKTGTPVGTLVARLYAHTGTFGSGGTPTGAALATSTNTVSVATLTTSPATVTFNFSPFTLTNGTAYCITHELVEADIGASGSVDSYLIAGDTVPGNRSSKNTSSVWNGTTGDLNFEVWAALPAAATVVSHDSLNLEITSATTNRLGAGSGSFVAGKLSEDGLVDNLGWTANNYTEVLYSVTLKQADLAPSDTLRFRVLRNGETTGLTYTQTPTVTIAGGGPTDVTGTATGSITLTGTATGVKEVTATATGTLTVAGTATGSAAAAPVLGTAAGTLTVVGVAQGVHGVAGTAVGSLAVAGVASGQKTVGATATGALAVAGTGVGVRGRPGTATGAVTVAGVASGIKTVTATATGTLTVAGTATGAGAAAPPVLGAATGILTVAGVATGQKTVAATATSSLTVAGTATGHKTITATATGQLAITGVAVGVRRGTATATGAITVGGTATGVRGRPGAATGAITVAGTASGQKVVTATATATLTVAGSSSGQKTVRATATGQIVVASIALGLVEGNAVGRAIGTIAITGSGTGRRGVTGTPTGAITVVGLATGRRATTGSATGLITVAGIVVAVRATVGTATGQFTVAGVALGHIPIAFDIQGQWNGQAVDAMQWGETTVVDWYMLTPT